MDTTKKARSSQGVFAFPLVSTCVRAEPANLLRLTGAQTPDLPTPLYQGPLVRQPEPAARLAHILWRASCDLQDVCTLDDRAQMWEEARAIASRILAATPAE